MKAKFTTFSFGCRVNQAETETIARDLVRAGFSYCPDSPDLAVVNTCAVTGKAEREARQLIYKLARLLPKSKIVITGCAATYWLKNGFYKKLPVLMLSNSSKQDLVKIVTKDIFGSKNDADFTSKFLSSKRMLLKIQDGCQRFCSYCIVPYLRGKPKSKQIKKILEEIKEVKKIQEIILTAINTEAYGMDNKESLPQLISAVLKHSGITRLSFGSINPWSLDNDFFNLYEKIAGSERFIDFFHIPLQSGSNKILKLMKREYTGQDYLKKIKRIKKINSLAYIATDIIVGFPGETEQDFNKTLNLLKAAPIDKLHVFRFSKRLGTTAYHMPDIYKEPLESIKKARSKALIALSNKKQAVFLKKHIGKSFPALFIAKPNNGFQPALLDNQVPALIRTDKDMSGTINKVKITKLAGGNLIGKI